MLCHVSMVLPDIYVIELDEVIGPYLNRFCYCSVGICPVALNKAVDGPEDAFLYLAMALQAIDHLPVSVGVFKVHVEAGRIGHAGAGEPSISAP